VSDGLLRVVDGGCSCRGRQRPQVEAVARAMQKTDVSVGDLVRMIELGELRLPELQRRYVWPATRARDLLDPLYRGYPSGSILVWETTEEVPARGFAPEQRARGYLTQKLLLDGQQRLTSLAAILPGKALTFKNRVRSVDIACNLDHPGGPPTEVTEVEDDSLFDGSGLCRDSRPSSWGSHGRRQKTACVSPSTSSARTRTSKTSHCCRRPCWLYRSRQQEGRTRFSAADFARRGPRNPLLQTTYLAVKHAGARVWRSGLGLSLSHSGKSHYIQVHHIFPKAA
jgi:hypothetical protein